MGRKPKTVPKKTVPEIESKLDSMEDLDNEEDEEEENETPLEEPEEEPVDLEVMRENQEIILKKLLDYSKAISVNQKYIRKIFEKHKELENNFKILLEKISN